MAVVFGATTATRLIHSWGTARGGSGDWILAMGWIRPTTLTAGRYVLQSAGTANAPRFGIKIHTTTTELAYEYDFSTTDPNYSTTSQGLAVSKWSFFAVLWGVNTTPTSQLLQLWTGSALEAPITAGLSTNTSPSGTPQTSTALAIGNNYAGNAAFQGDIARLCVIMQSYEAGGLMLLPLSSNSNALTTSQFEYITNAVVTPYWNDTVFPWVGRFSSIQPAAFYLEANGYIDGYRSSAESATTRATPWISGSTAQLLVATSAVTTTNWNGAITAIDETIASDADFMYSTNNTVATLEYHITDPTPPAGISPTIRYRIAKTNAGTVDGGGNSLTVTASVIEGTTVLASDTARTPDGTWTQYDWTPTLSTTMNWNDIRLRFETTASGGSPAVRRGCGLSWGVADIPTEAAPTVDLAQPRQPGLRQCITRSTSVM